jgi:sorting nexin-8
MNPLIEQWQKICVLAERVIKRRESAAVWVSPNVRPIYVPAHSIFPFWSNLLLNVRGIPAPVSQMSGSGHSVRIDASFEPDVSDEQADLARLTNVLRVVVEVNERCWRGDDCELCDGVRMGIGRIAEHTQQQSDLLEQRVRSHFISQVGARTEFNRHTLCYSRRWSL